MVSQESLGKQLMIRTRAGGVVQVVSHESLGKQLMIRTRAGGVPGEFVRTADDQDQSKYCPRRV